ncbi:BZ3500_MvSof-1268-A1-R1_C094g00514 [Microbotryum saponariae]|uniref:BZ3500_MvSof-1268-A1-R1_C094g00514 protein n=1 Tax=Microbotryum saponariae TaxID=289078 RepID=A0A2X0MUZ7_9BASI|nr:BZ3500_MvSof-1268-A1-R1_Chr3-3g06633 [Microbotryum saponariae]SDA04044.1 BZ3500_MvSof-1268-A1-R1_C094g00514 [Microbotryum saponariae]SDA04600.1 BZ3501_MvSof-1269-A2-R1_Chr3-2g06320 [Microbotryum saponariae]
MRHSIRKMQLDFSQLQLDVVLAYVDASLERPRSHTCSVTQSPRSPRSPSRHSTDACVQIARWPTRWHPRFAPNRSVTCTIMLATPAQVPRQHHRGDNYFPQFSNRCTLTICSATPTSFTRVINVKQSHECNPSHLFHDRIEELIDAASSGLIGDVYRHKHFHPVSTAPQITQPPAIVIQLVESSVQSHYVSL